MREGDLPKPEEEGTDDSCCCAPLVFVFVFGVEEELEEERSIELIRVAEDGISG